MVYNQKVPILSDLKLRGENPEYLFWIGCAGSFDDRSKKVTKAFVKILNKANISYAILGKEESLGFTFIHNVSNYLKVKFGGLYVK